MSVPTAKSRNNPTGRSGAGLRGTRYGQSGGIPAQDESQENVQPSADAPAPDTDSIQISQPTEQVTTPPDSPAMPVVQHITRSQEKKAKKTRQRVSNRNRPRLPEHARPPTYLCSVATWHWWLNKLLGRLFGLRDKQNPEFLRVPQPGKRERAMRDNMQLKFSLVTAMTQLRALLNVPGLELDLYVANARGQSHKTSISYLIGSAITWIGQIPASLWTATLNTSVGAAAAMSGLPPEQLENSRLSTLVANRYEYHTPQDIYNGPLKLARTNTGLVLVVDDRHGNDGRQRPRLTPDMYEETTRCVRPLIAGPSISDGGNDGQDDGDFLYMLGHNAAVMIVVADANSEGSLDNLSGAINGMRSAPADFRMPEESQGANSYVSLPTKARNSVLVASNWRGVGTFDFDPYLVPDPYLKYEEEPGEFEGERLTVPHEPSLLSRGPGQPVVFNWFGIQRQTQLAGMRIVIAAARMAAKMQDVDISFVDYLEPDFAAASYLFNMDVSDVMRWYAREQELNAQQARAASNQSELNAPLPPVESSQTAL